jgi:hypothetical protein
VPRIEDALVTAGANVTALISAVAGAGWSVTLTISATTWETALLICLLKRLLLFGFCFLLPSESLGECQS